MDSVVSELPTDWTRASLDLPWSSTSLTSKSCFLPSLSQVQSPSKHLTPQLHLNDNLKEPYLWQALAYFVAWFMLRTPNFTLDIWTMSFKSEKMLFSFNKPWLSKLLPIDGKTDWIWSSQLRNNSFVLYCVYRFLEAMNDCQWFLGQISGKFLKDALYAAHFPSNWISVKDMARLSSMIPTSPILYHIYQSPSPNNSLSWTSLGSTLLSISIATIVCCPDFYRSQISVGCHFNPPLPLSFQHLWVK